nr:hypothetical transcript [Hymenolepis microstoma]
MEESLEPNCQKSSMICNPVKEFDTELFQTETRESPKDLAEDSNPIHGDIHNFLPELSTISIKRRNKRKRKTAKLTAAN